MLAQLRAIRAFLAAHPLTRQHRLSAAARVLRWQIESRLRDEVIVDWIGGTRLAAKRGMTGATGNIYAGLHEFADMAFVLHFLRPGDLFADIGANIGSYTLLASGVAGCCTVAFEPDPGTALALERNIKLNRLDQLVEIRIAAAGERYGTVRFSVGLDTINHVTMAADEEARPVRMERLDKALAGRTPRLMKIDVEGYEHQVLLGAPGILASPGFTAVLTENRSPAVVGMLENAGLTEWCYDAFNHRLVPAGQAVMANALFLRDKNFVMERVSRARPVRVLDQMV